MDLPLNDEVFVTVDDGDGLAPIFGDEDFFQPAGPLEDDVDRAADTNAGDEEEEDDDALPFPIVDEAVADEDKDEEVLPFLDLSAKF